MNDELINLSKDDVLCKEGDKTQDLYYITEGKLLICSRSGKMVTPIAYLEAGSYFGEMSFFDKLPRSADVIAIEPTKLVKISQIQLKDSFPKWLLVISRQMTKKIRLLDEVIRDKGIKRTNVQSVKPLSIDEQRHYLTLLEKA